MCRCCSDWNNNILWAGNETKFLKSKVKSRPTYCLPNDNLTICMHLQSPGDSLFANDKITMICHSISIGATSFLSGKQATPDSIRYRKCCDIFWNDNRASRDAYNYMLFPIKWNPLLIISYLSYLIKRGLMKILIFSFFQKRIFSRVFYFRKLANTWVFSKVSGDYLCNLSHYWYEIDRLLYPKFANMKTSTQLNVL